MGETILVIGIVVILLGVWVAVHSAISSLMGKKFEDDRLLSLSLAVLFAYGMLWQIHTPLFAGFVGGLGLFFFADYLLQVVHFDYSPPWWVSILSILAGIMIFLAYPIFYQDLPDFLQGLSGPAFLMAEGIAFVGGLALFYPKKPTIKSQ